jgi:hypothetical protein
MILTYSMRSSRTTTTGIRLRNAARNGRRWAERTPQVRFTQAENQIGEEISQCSEAVKSALTRETFSDEAGVKIPREVFI